jgi:glycosyltransferase involved in cell wall biosynthesis
MRILVLCKRRYTGKDLLDDRYGRLYELPAALAAFGHDVRGLALSYRRSGAVRARRDGPRLAWWSADALPWGLVRYGSAVAAVAADWQPEAIWASSDILHAVLAEREARRRRIPLVVDLYDNYESFGMASLPGLTAAFRRACARADGLSVVSHTLAELMRNTHGTSKPLRVVVNGVDEKLFRARPKRDCRMALGLPADARLVGTAGSITADRGIADLFDAFERLAAHDEQLRLVIAGPRDSTRARYRHPRIIDLGVLPAAGVPDVLSALDVAVVCNRDSAFGRYCFPLKLHEMLACRVPVVAAAVGDVANVLSGRPDRLYAPGDAADLAHKVDKVLRDGGREQDYDVPTWRDCGRELDGLLAEIAPRRAGG